MVARGRDSLGSRPRNPPSTIDRVNGPPRRRRRSKSGGNNRLVAGRKKEKKKIIQTLFSSRRLVVTPVETGRFGTGDDNEKNPVNTKDQPQHRLNTAASHHLASGLIAAFYDNNTNWWNTISSAGNKKEKVPLWGRTRRGMKRPEVLLNSQHQLRFEPLLKRVSRRLDVFPR